MEVNGITIVSPMWGDRNKTDRMVFSVFHQYIEKENPFNIHLVLVDDYIEKRGYNNESYYDIYVSEDFKQFYDTEHIKISIIKNQEHKYQGESREIGYMSGDYPFFLLIDCDDMLAPNACDRYISILRENINKNKIACVEGLLYGFSAGGNEQIINGDSIWVQSRCYNREFLIKHDIHFPVGYNSKCGEDYPFMRKLDYAIHHQEEYQCIQYDFNSNTNLQCHAYWFPNDDSLSRQNPHYTQHLSGWTMKSSFEIIRYMKQFNYINGIIEQEDENMKHEVLNMNIYAFYNLLDFIKEIATTDYTPVTEDWYALRNSVDKLRTILKDDYWDELVYSDIEDMLYNVRHYSDCHFCESWIGTFYDYMNYDVGILHMSYETMLEYAHSLEFDGADHEIHTPYVQAWMKRHNKQED